MVDVPTDTTPTSPISVVEVVSPHTGTTFAAMRELRPHLTDLEAYVVQVDLVQRREGYRLAAVYLPDSTDAVAIAGFRETTNTSRGRHLYVDDLSTLPSARGRGYGRALLDWVHAEAQRRGLATVDLDSGVGENRQTAHRLYFNAGYRISSYHFDRTVERVEQEGPAAPCARQHLVVAPEDPADRERIVRAAVRVIMIDDADQTLLFADSDPLLPQHSWWVTPGGGIDPGESERAAAVREVAEETGCVVAESDLIGPIARRRAVHGYSDQVVDQTEAFYAVRVTAFEVSLAGHTEEEQLTLTGHRWWSRGELVGTDDWIWPAELAQLWGLVERPDAWPLDLGTVESESTRPV